MINKIVSIVIVIILILVLSITLCGCSNTINITEEHLTSIDSELGEYDEIEYIDSKIKFITETDEYKSAEIDERKAIINQLLIQLKKDKRIRNFSYNKDNFLLSFEYLDGSLGGVMIKEFDTLMD